LEKPVSNPKQETFDPDILLTELTMLKAAFDDFDASLISEITSKLQTYAQIPCIGNDIEKILHYKISGEYDEAAFVIDKVVKDLEG